MSRTKQNNQSEQTGTDTFVLPEMETALKASLSALDPGLDSPGLRYFLDYVRYPSQADESAQTCPSSPGQLVLAERLLSDLKVLGLEAEHDGQGYVYARLEANTTLASGEEPIKLGLIAHMDTACELGDDGVFPRISHYDGEAIQLDPQGEYYLGEATFPAMRKLRGKHLVHTSGNTLLGADDKAGVAAIMGLLRRLHDDPGIQHGPLSIAFTPDEEIGRGPKRFDLKKFDADLAYTIDGGELGELECESFNAAAAHIVFKGRSVHPGSAKDKMVNACLLARDFAALLPDAETPAHTEGYEGFFHLTDMEGGVEEACLNYIIRDFDRQAFEARKQKLKDLVAEMNQGLDEERVEIHIRDQYFNMREVVDRYPILLDKAREAMEMAGVQPIEHPIRGGTDGSQLSFMGLPCPNLFTGGDNFHGRYEYLVIESFNLLQECLKNLCVLYAQTGRKALA